MGGASITRWHTAQGRILARPRFPAGCQWNVWFGQEGDHHEQNFCCGAVGTNHAQAWLPWGTKCGPGKGCGHGGGCAIKAEGVCRLALPGVRTGSPLLGADPPLVDGWVGCPPVGLGVKKGVQKKPPEVGSQMGYLMARGKLSFFLFRPKPSTSVRDCSALQTHGLRQYPPPPPLYKLRRSPKLIRSLRLL